ncbi:MAG: LysM peptidoglycan-binding domain-containing protein [Acutalibacteraceae bacterium]
MKHSKHLLSSLFYVPKYEKVSDKAFLRIMLSSVFGILICGICLAGLTWAWFSSAVTSTANNITAAKFTVNINVTAEGTAAPLSPKEENGGYTYDELTADKKYTVTVTADGSATATTGYCTVKLDGTTYHTIQLYPAGGDGKPQSVAFTVQGSELTIIPQWGTFGTTTGESLIGNGLSSISATETNTEPQAALSAVLPEAQQETTEANITYALTDTEQSYTIQQGDTLSEIANRYGTTTALLSAYNNIENAAEIQVGETLKIPPANVAEEITDSETQSVPDTDTTENATDEP